MGGHRHGLVVVGYGSDSIVQTEDGQLYRCLTRRRTGRAVCGDRVEWTPGSGDAGTIERILPRRNELTRTNYRGRASVLAANLDCLLVVLAPEPDVDRELVDRYLVLAKHLDVEPLLVYNKADMAAPSPPDRDALAPWRALGIPVVRTSAKKNEGLDALRDWLGDRVGILVGQSGVGKSSLINALIPDRETRTQALSAASGQGRHTTTETTWYPLPDRGALLDSPGIRILRLGHLTPADIQAGFTEFTSYEDRCQYRNCTHRTEPGCAIREAADQGKLDERRLNSYRALISEAEVLSGKY